MTERLTFKNAAIALLSGWLALFALVPNLLVLGTSFLRRHDSDFVALEFTLENYFLLINPVYLEVFVLSTLLALAATVGCLLVGYPFAFLLARQSPARRRLPTRAAPTGRGWRAARLARCPTCRACCSA